MQANSDLSELLKRVRACTHCADHLPSGPRPVLQAHKDARILIAGQAPGRIVHESGVPFQDASGRRLRDWMGIDEATFYDAHRMAILPMGFCYPGTGKSGDLPPRPECAPLWRKALLEQLTKLRLTLIIGTYAQGWHLGSTQSLTEQVRQGLTSLSQAGAASILLPHPSPRNNPWLKKNAWFEADLLPKLRSAVSVALVN